MHLDGEQATVNGRTYDFDVQALDEQDAERAESAGKTQVRSELPGRVLRVDVTTGDLVREGQVLLVLEALKMEMEVRAPIGGAIAEVPVGVGDQVKGGDALVVIG